MADALTELSKLTTEWPADNAYVKSRIFYTDCFTTEKP